MGASRRVHFAVDDSQESAPTIEILGPLLIPSSEMSILDKREIWWQARELESFLLNAKVTAAESRRRDSTHDQTCYAHVLLSVYKSCKELKSKGPTNKQRYNLCQWTKVAHTRRGLERVCVREMGASRSRQKQEAIQGILRAQRRLKKGSTQEEKEYLLSMVSKTLTRPARLYAAVMGEADAVASLVDRDLNVNLWNDYDKSLIADSSPKVMTSLRIGVRLLRRASFTGGARIGTRHKKRRLSS